MKNRKARWLSGLLALLMVPAIVTGCATQAEAENANISDTESVQSQTSEPEEEPRQEEVSEQEEALQADGYPARPAMWEVTDPESGNSIYLFGSIHAAEDNLYPMDDEILEAFRSCDSLAVEVDVLAYTEDMTKAMEMAAYMMYMDGSTITDVIDEELVVRVQQLLEDEGMDLGVPMEMTEMFRPYTFISLLTDVGIQKAGLSAEQGVDMYFLQLARDLEMEILEVETMESQLGMFNEFSPAVLTYLLEEGLQVEAAGEGVRALYDAWKAGDLDGLLAISEDADEATEPEELDEAMQAVMEEYNEALLTDRNGWMSDVAEEYLQQGQKVFYVVGALHMVGDDGIVQQLIDRGYAVSRI